MRKIFLTILLGMAFLLTSCAVVPPNQPPVAVLKAHPSCGPAPYGVNFDISDSHDPDGVIVGFELDFGDGTPPVIGTDITQPITYTYISWGSFVATLTVRDNLGAEGKASVEILVIVPQDDFNDNIINSCLWVAFQVGFGPTVDEINQRLEITIPANSADDPILRTFRAGYRSVCQLRGDFDIQVDYQLLTWPSANGVRVGISIIPILGEPHDVHGGGSVERVSFMMIDVEAYSAPSHEVYLTHFIDGVQGITATEDMSGKLRVVRTGDSLTGFYFSSGNWVSIHTSSGTTADVYFSLSSWSHDRVFADQQVKVAFDDFIVNQGEFVCPD